MVMVGEEALKVEGPGKGPVCKHANPQTGGGQRGKGRKGKGRGGVFADCMQVTLKGLEVQLSRM